MCRAARQAQLYFAAGKGRLFTTTTTKIAILRSSSGIPAGAPCPRPKAPPVQQPTVWPAYARRLSCRLTGLLIFGPSPSLQVGATALHVASQRGHRQVVQELLGAGANADAPDEARAVRALGGGQGGGYPVGNLRIGEQEGRERCPKCHPQNKRPALRKAATAALDRPCRLTCLWVRLFFVCRLPSLSVRCLGLAEGCDATV